MAKIYGLFGSMTGKLADTVMAVRNGEQLARKYQPVVYNPSTPAQIAQRAKMKLLSQLSAVMAPVIAIPRTGSVSSRNKFTKVNFPLTSYASNTADITLADVQLTSSVVALPDVTISRNADHILYGLNLNGGQETVNVDRVVYALFEKQTDGKIRLVISNVVSDGGSSGNWDSGWAITSNNEFLVLAYGVRDNNEAARVTFGNLEAQTAETIAKLIVTRALTETDVTLTETKGAVLPAVD